MNIPEQIIISSDHAGFELKERLKLLLESLGHSVIDVGTYSASSVDYPEYAAKVASAVARHEYNRGITICGTGIGSSIAANRFKGVRAALCLTEDMARLSRQHNNANVLVLGGRIISFETAEKIVKIWLTTPFEAGRHESRINQLDHFSECT